MKNLLNLVISEDNVQMIGETIAVKAVKTVASHAGGQLDFLYKGLLFDVYKRNTPNHTFSDGYDFAQMAICFLWEHKGKKLSDYYGKSKKGKESNILYACYHYIDKNLYNYKKRVMSIDSLHDKDKDFDSMPHEDKKEDDYTKADAIISKMNLKKGEIDVLNCYLARMTYCQIARFLNVDFSTVYARRKRIQKKYFGLYQN